MALEEWEQVRQAGLPVLSWWELIVKPGIRKIAMSRNKEMNEARKLESAPLTPMSFSEEAAASSKTPVDQPNTRTSWDSN